MRFANTLRWLFLLVVHIHKRCRNNKYVFDSDWISLVFEEKSFLKEVTASIS